MLEHIEQKLPGKNGFFRGIRISLISGQGSCERNLGKDLRSKEVLQMNSKIKGTVTVKFGDDINTDYIIPAYLLQEAWYKRFFAAYAFEKYYPDFPKICAANPYNDNIIVAGINFGCGSSREQA